MQVNPCDVCQPPYIPLTASAVMANIGSSRECFECAEQEEAAATAFAQLAAGAAGTLYGVHLSLKVCERIQKDGISVRRALQGVLAISLTVSSAVLASYPFFGSSSSE